MAAVDTIFEGLGKLTVLELVDLKNKIEEEWGITAAAPVAVAAAGAPAGDGAAVEEKTSFDVVLTRCGRPEDPGDQGRPRGHRSRSQGGQGSRRLGSEAGQGRREPGRGRPGQGAARRGRRLGRAQVATAVRGAARARLRRRARAVFHSRRRVPVRACRPKRYASSPSTITSRRRARSDDVASSSSNSTTRVQPGVDPGDASHGREQPVAPPPVGDPHAPHVAVVAAGRDQLGERELVERARPVAVRARSEHGIEELARDDEPAEAHAGREALRRGPRVDDVLRRERLQRTDGAPVVAELAVVVVLDHDSAGRPRPRDDFTPSPR